MALQDMRSLTLSAPEMEDICDATSAIVLDGCIMMYDALFAARGECISDSCSGHMDEN